jgi:hypothetical protein
MKNLLFGLAAVPFLVGSALAAKPLSDAQMNRITAGACSAGFTCSTGNGMSTISACPGCSGGQAFTVAVGQPLFAAVVEFLNQNGYKPQ